MSGKAHPHSLQAAEGQSFQDGWQRCRRLVMALASKSRDCGLESTFASNSSLSLALGQWSQCLVRHSGGNRLVPVRDAGVGTHGS